MIKWFLIALIYYVELAYFYLILSLDFTSRISLPDLKELSTNSWWYAQKNRLYFTK